MVRIDTKIVRIVTRIVKISALRVRKETGLTRMAIILGLIHTYT